MAKTTPEQRFSKIFATFIDSATPPNLRANAERAMDRWLKDHGKTRADIKAILAKAQADDIAAQPPSPPSDPRDAADPPRPLGGNAVLLNLIRALLREYVVMSEHDYVAATLWAAHAHVYDRFDITPRLVLTSPIRGCGKTTLLEVLSRLVARPELFDSITAAGVYDSTDKHSTLLLDEADNLELSAKAALRSVLNSGYRKGHRIKRGKGKHASKYDTFAPIALASIGFLTLPLMSRSVVLHMRKNDGSRRLRRFIEGKTEELDIAYKYLHLWALDPKLELNPDPEMPSEVSLNREADNWRTLISIADSFGEQWGTLAREAAVAFLDGYSEDILVILLRDVREVFDATGADRLLTATIVEALHAMEEGGWDAWRGEDGDLRPHKFTKAEFSHLMRERFRVKSRSLRPHPGDKTGKGFYRVDLEPLWAAYCGGAGTAARPVLRVIGPSE
jgi:Protein of unknown function (DUF3631)